MCVRERAKTRVWKRERERDEYAIDFYTCVCVCV